MTRHLPCVSPTSDSSGRKHGPSASDPVTASEGTSYPSLRKKIYKTLEELQVDLDAWLVAYNTEREKRIAPRVEAVGFDGRYLPAPAGGPLRPNLAAKLLVPLEEDFPVLGGKTLKVRAGVELAYINQRPVVVLKGVSVMGVPIPNAWLGGMKNIDLIEYYGNETGFWKAFADGVDNIRIEDGHVTMVLKE